MFDVFSDIFARRDNALTRIDPRAKLVAAVSVIILVILSDNMLMPLATALVCLVTMPALGIPVVLIAVRLLPPLAIVSVLVVLKTFLTTGSVIFTITILGHNFCATQEGLKIGLVMGSRVVGAVSVIILLSAVTPADKVFQALRWFGVPEAWVEIALLVYRYVFVVADQTADVIAAQKVRLGYSSLRRSMSSLSQVAGTVVVRSMDQAMRTYEAMTLRATTEPTRLHRCPKWAISTALLC
jgi:cobalt/nickel transport system permease protein